ncbi:response regulator containing a CheY-like receiver domain and an HTH DNA-binding domain [Opitutaceae bacterium TAV1]|nr:response regulator containing a CheY-like receiver domain and an HTH DNA-binding domain [Opitutaceae bacterium TAV1]
MATRSSSLQLPAEHLSSGLLHRFSQALAEIHAAGSPASLLEISERLVDEWMPDAAESVREEWRFRLRAAAAGRATGESGRNPENAVASGYGGSDGHTRDGAVFRVALFVHHVADQAAHLGARPAPSGFPPMSFPVRLTPREREVLEHVAAGEPDAAIGRILGISSRTVEKHVEHILKKLGVEHRAAAVATLRAGAGSSGSRSPIPRPALAS